MRLVRLGPTDLKVVQVIEGLKEGDKVLSLGTILASKPAVAPKLQIAANMQRGASPTRAAQAGEVAKSTKSSEVASKAAKKP